MDPETVYSTLIPLELKVKEEYLNPFFCYFAPPVGFYVYLLQTIPPLIANHQYKYYTAQTHKFCC
jgi:hypothetical protein